MAIRRVDRARLARLAAPRLLAGRDAVRRRVELREDANFFALIEALLRLEGVDPESTCVVRRLREAEAALAAIPDTAELRRADKDYLARADTRWIDEEWARGQHYQAPPGEQKTLASEVTRLIGRYRTDITKENFATASPPELFAWCLSRHGATIDEAAADIAKTTNGLLLFRDASPDGRPPAGSERTALAEHDQ